MNAQFGFNDFGSSVAIKRLRGAVGWTLLSLSKTAGVAQLVEHHLAKVDVASSSLVTRSSLLMFYVYLLKSESPPRQPYVGSTCDLRRRLRDDNQGRCSHTAKFRPWIVIAYFAFVHEQTAIAFEKHLKSGSGRAFINRHFL